MVNKKKRPKQKDKKELHSWNKRVRNMSYHDLKHVKLASIAFALFLVSVWSNFGEWVMEVHWGWFLGLTILFSIKPWTSFWGKKK